VEKVAIPSHLSGETATYGTLYSQDIPLPGRKLYTRPPKNEVGLLIIHQRSVLACH
jgi:hypothetical protein